MSSRRVYTGNIRWRYGLWAATLCMGIAVLLRVITSIHPYWSWLIACNVVALGEFLLDKQRAQHEGAVRVPEAVLIGLIAAGGVLGAWLGMYVLQRHKVRKLDFNLFLVVSTAAHASLLYRIFWFGT